MELWERGPALAALDRLFAASASGGRVALLGAEAGLGKTAVVSEFARATAPRARVLWGACDRLVTPRALGPLHDIGRLTGGRLAAALTANEPREAVYAAFLDELVTAHARRRPMVVVEDVHWADEATLDWLAFVGRRIERLPALLVVTYRDDEVGTEHPLRRTLAAFPAAVLDRVEVRPLSDDLVIEQARLAGRDPEGVRRLAAGNPLFLTELLKTDDGPVPVAVQNLVLDRIARLSGPARDLAHLVAVVPTRTEADLLDSADTVDECIGSGILGPSGTGVAYRHEILRSAVEDSLSSSRRRALHRRVLGVLEGVDGVDPGRLVHHARLSGEAEPVLRYARVAGADAARQGAHREAYEHYRAAVAHTDRLEEPDRAELLELYAVEAYLSGHYDDALGARRTALALREVLSQPEQMSENLRWISHLAWWSGQVKVSGQPAGRALALLESRPVTPELVMAYAESASVAVRNGDYRGSIELAEEGSRLALELGDDPSAYHPQVTLHFARLAMGDRGSLAALLALHHDAAARQLVDPAARALATAATVVGDELADFTAAGPLLDDALGFAARHEMHGLHHAVLGFRARVRLERGDWDGAAADAETALAEAGDTGMTSVLPLLTLGRIQAARGNPAAGGTLERAAHAAEQVGDVSLIAAVADGLAEHWAWAGQDERARAEARSGMVAAGGDHGPEFVVGRLAYRLWRAGDRSPPPAVTAAPFLAMIEGRWAEAAAEWERRGATYLQAAALGQGDEPAADEALRTLTRLGAFAAAEHLRADLRRRGVAYASRGPRRVTSGDSAGLTPRQLDVLRAVAEGLSDADIADRLALSTKTVSHHMSAILRKLEVTSRGQAAAKAHRLGLAGREPG